MDIGFYIADLLRSQDEVSLPGLGTFTRERVAASFDISSKSFRPPSYRVSFDNRFTDRTSLSEYISIKKNLSRSSAEYFVKKFTSSLFELLQTSGIAEVKPLGIMRQSENILVFEPASGLDVAGKFYGLKKIPDRPGSPEQAAPETTAPADETKNTPASISKGSFIEDFITGQGSEEQAEQEEEYAEESSNNRKLYIISSAIVSAIVISVLLYLYHPTTREMVNSVFLQPAPAKSAPPKPDITTRTSASLSDSINVQSPDTATTDSAGSVPPVTEIKEPETEEITTYEIVGATLARRSEAEAYIKAMKGRGIQAKILENMPGTLFKVSIGSYPDAETAQNELNRIVKEVEKSAWTTKYKSKKIK